MNRESCLQKITGARRIVIKVGTSLLRAQDEPHGVNQAMVTRLRDTVLFLRERNIAPLIVTSGAVDMGRGALSRLGAYKPLAEPAMQRRQALAAIGHHRLMSVYSDLFEAAGIPTAQLLITARDLRDRRNYLNIGNTMSELAAMHALPIVNENDTVSTEELRYGDNDVLSAACASLFRADALLILTSVDGFLVDGTVAPFFSRVGAEQYAHAGDAEGPGTGGMRTKLRAAELCMRVGEAMAILPGSHTSPVQSLFAEAEAVAAGQKPAEQLGTLFAGTPGRRLSARKRWLLYARSTGTVRVDAGARQALVERGSSLLPVGLLGHRGRYLAGDVVEVEDELGRVLGRGIVNYSFREAAPMIGLSGAQMKDRGLQLRAAELIHRNNLILEDVDHGAPFHYSDWTPGNTRRPS